MSDLVLHLLTFGAGAALLIGGGELLVRGAVRLAKLLGVSALVIGLTVVAFGTSAPELSLNVIAALNGNAGISFGNIIGSNIANVGLILGLAALVAPLAVHPGVVRREMPFMLMATAATAALAFLPVPLGAPFDDTGSMLGRVDGGVLLLGFVVFNVIVLRIARQDRALAEQFASEADELDGSDGGSPVAAGAMFIVGLAVLLVGGWLAERGAVATATSLGVSQEVVGLTVVAVATSLPELVTSLIAIRKGEVDIAVGNVVGSNIFNLLLVLGATAALAPLPLPAEGGWIAIAVMGGLSLALWPMTWTGGRTLSRFEGLALLTVYGAYTAWLVIEATAARGA
ncbi:MAG: calcium/sodium antiporter [Planctomycetota bacterium]